MKFFFHGFYVLYGIYVPVCLGAGAAYAVEAFVVSVSCTLVLTCCSFHTPLDWVVIFATLA
jgi:hypothetical protein